MEKRTSWRYHGERREWFKSSVFAELRVSVVVSVSRTAACAWLSLFSPCRYSTSAAAGQAKLRYSELYSFGVARGCVLARLMAAVAQETVASAAGQ